MKEIELWQIELDFGDQHPSMRDRLNVIVVV
jgi:hypothetical protein